MTVLTLHGGVNEIGGNKILLESGGARVWFDFGMSFGQAGKYFSEFLQPKKFNGVNDFIATGLLPELDDMCGLYRPDYLRHCDMPVDDKPAYDAVFLTHAHADHSSYIHFLRPDIPVYASAVTRHTLYAIQITSGVGLTEFTTFNESFCLVPKKTTAGLTRLKGEQARSPRNFQSMAVGQPVNTGNLRIEAIPVNHSLPGAYAYFISASEGNIIYTGDLRFHGYGGDLSRRFVETAARLKPVAMLCEGTRIDETSSVSEASVQEKIAGMVKGKSLVIANFPVRDTERLTSFLEVARATNRRLAISLKQAFLLQQLGKVGEGPSLEDKNLAIYARRKNWGLITKSGFTEDMVKQDYDDWERDLIYHPNAVTCQDISAHQTDFIVRLDFFELPELISLKPARNSCYIRSLTEPIDEEDLIDLKRVENWLKLFDLFPYQKAHASGHASGADLKTMIEAINPRVLVPVHTEHPEKFKELLPAINVTIPEKGRGISIR